MISLDGSVEWEQTYGGGQDGDPVTIVYNAARDEILLGGDYHRVRERSDRSALPKFECRVRVHARDALEQSGRGVGYLAWADELDTRDAGADSCSDEPSRTRAPKS